MYWVQESTVKFLYTHHMSFDMQNMWFCKELGYHDSKATRSHVSSSFSSASCQATYEASTNHLSQTVSPTQTFPIEEDPPVHISEDLPDLIDFSQERFPGCSFPRSAPRQITDYRYLTVGMGCPPLRHMHSWAMVPRWTATSYQSFRTEDSPLCHLVLPTSPNWTSFGDFFRQHIAVTYLNRQGGTVSRSLCKLEVEIWDLCIVNHIFLMARHVPGIENITANSLSSQSTSIHKWELGDESLLPVFNAWGFTDVDVFATRHNAKRKWFCTRGGRDTLSKGNGLLLKWSGWFLHIFPPLPLLPRVIQKLQNQLALAILVAPSSLWENWFPGLLHLSKRIYHKFPLFANQLTVNNWDSPSWRTPSGANSMAYHSHHLSLRVSEVIQNSKKQSTRLSYEHN